MTHRFEDTRSEGRTRRTIRSHMDTAERKHADEAIRDAEERLRLAVEATELGTWEYDPATPSVRWSDRCNAIFGLPPEAHVDYELFLALVHPDDRDRVHRAVQHAMDPHGAGDFALEYRCRRPDGAIRWVFAKGRCFFEGTGLRRRPVHVTGIVLDITERRHADETLRASERRRELALAAARLGSWYLDLATWKLSCSAGCKANFGLPPDADFTYEALLSAIHPDDRADMQASVARALQERTEYRAEYRAVWPDHSIHWIAANGVVTYSDDGRPLVMDGVTLDVTDRKDLEESLRRQASALEEADRRKDEFLAVLSHELRNPLAPMRTGLEILALRGDDPGAVAQVRDVMDRQVRQLVRLVDDLLEVSRITRGKIALKLQPVDLAAVITTAVETSRPLIDARRHELTVTLPARPVYIDGDAARLAQVLTNLLNNAAKYTEVGGAIEVRAERAEDEAVVRVRDTGIGIAPEMLSRVFDLFIQADSSAHSAQSGLGIGLTLVRRLIEMHGGRVEVASAGVGRGSEFVVRLPALPEGITDSGRDRTEDASGRSLRDSRRVLVVDDNVDAAEALGTFLSLSGHDVRLAHDGEAAIADALSFRPDVMLLDIGLPRRDGFEVVQELRREPNLPAITFVALTGYSRDEDRRHSQEVGFEHYLVKPVDPEALLTLLALSPRLGA